MAQFHRSDRYGQHTFFGSNSAQGQYRRELSGGPRRHRLRSCIGHRGVRQPCRNSNIVLE